MKVLARISVSAATAVVIAASSALFACSAGVTPVDAPPTERAPEPLSPVPPSPPAPPATSAPGPAEPPPRTDPSRGDPCSAVVESLALGLAEGATGLANTRAVRVSFAGEDIHRRYTFVVDGNAFTVNDQTFDNDTAYEVLLDGDSHALCTVVSVKLAPRFTPGANEALETREIFPDASGAAPEEGQDAVHLPARDACASVLRHLARAVAVSAVGAGPSLVSADVTLRASTTTRLYDLAVDGREITANGATFPNDHRFSIELDDDSASMCLPLRIE